MQQHPATAASRFNLEAKRTANDSQWAVSRHPCASCSSICSNNCCASGWAALTVGILPCPYSTLASMPTASNLRKKNKAISLSCCCDALPRHLQVSLSCNTGRHYLQKPVNMYFLRLFSNPMLFGRQPAAPMLPQRSKYKQRNRLCLYCPTLQVSLMSQHRKAAVLNQKRDDDAKAKELWFS